MFKTISKTLILTGFLFVSALAFGYGSYYQQCIDITNAEKIMRLTEEYDRLDILITSLSAVEDTYTRQIESLEHEHGLTGPNPLFPTKEIVLDEWLFLRYQRSDIAEARRPLQAEFESIHYQLSNLCSY